MKTLRAVLSGALIWVLIFVEISITMIGFKLPELWTWIAHYILLIPIVFFCAWLYYESGDRANGLILGLLFLAVGIILDLIVTVPLFIMLQGSSYATYFSNLYMIAGFIESVVLVGIYDKMRKK